MKILVLGSGGREHALAHTFVRQGHTVYCHPGNPGINAIARSHTWSSDYTSLVKEVKQANIDLTVVGPEIYLERGIQDLFAAHNLALFGPSRSAARLETSKAFAKQFMAKYHIPSARFAICTKTAEALLAARSLFAEGTGVVVKASGLAAGKGVFCCATLEEASFAIRKLLEEHAFGASGQEIVIEESLSGPEISLQTLCDGHVIQPLIPSQDHKKLYDDNQGPNTGGMGAYAPLPFVTKEIETEIEQTIVQPTLAGLKRESISYRGLLYFGLMLTKTGPKVLEYNCRFGDPETQAILPLLKTDLADVMLRCALGALPPSPIEFTSMASCCVVLAGQGYPSSACKRERIEPPQDHEKVFFFHAGTAYDAQGKLCTAGGRVLGVTALGATIFEAVDAVYAAIDAMHCPWAHFRRDIGREALSKTI